VGAVAALAGGRQLFAARLCLAVQALVVEPQLFGVAGAAFHLLELGFVREVAALEFGVTAVAANGGVRRAAQRLGGRLQVSSSPGKGVQVRVLLGQA
jgi:hypothetical protein